MDPCPPRKLKTQRCTDEMLKSTHSIIANHPSNALVFPFEPMGIAMDQAKPMRLERGPVADPAAIPKSRSPRLQFLRLKKAGWSIDAPLHLSSAVLFLMCFHKSQFCSRWSVVSPRTPFYCAASQLSGAPWERFGLVLQHGNMRRNMRLVPRLETVVPHVPLHSVPHPVLVRKVLEVASPL